MLSLATDFDVLAKLSAEQIGRLARTFESNNCPSAEKIREAAGTDFDDLDIDRIVRSFNFVLGKASKSDWKSLLSSSSWDEEKISAVRGAIGESYVKEPVVMSELPHVHDLEISTGFQHISGGNKDYKLMIRLIVRAGLHSKNGKTDTQMQLDLDSAEKLAHMLNEQIRLVSNHIRPAPERVKGHAAQWQHIAHDSIHIEQCGPRVWSSKADAEARSKEFREMCGIEHTEGPVQSIAGMLDKYVKDGDVDATTLIREMRGRG